MKVAIMSWFQYHNYGTALQITALSQWLKNHGHDPYIVNYTSGKSPVSKHTHSMLYDFVEELSKRVKNHPYHRYEEKYREKSFEVFLKLKNQFTKKCVNMSDLESLNAEFDAFLCGSDQIWSPSVYNPHYFLDYVRDSETMIAYAPSIGLPKIDDENIKQRMKELTARFSHLSTREKQGSQIISQLVNRYVETVVDPSLLLTSEEWMSFANDYANNFAPYMLVYMLGNTEAYWKKIYDVARKLKLEVRIVPVFCRDLNRIGCCEDAIGPSEFLSLVLNSSYVATDSFHGLAFALNFHKDFCVFERFGNRDKLNQNSRIYNILELTGLQDRLYKKHSQDAITESIDYDNVETILHKERNKSECYLLDALKEVKDHNDNRKRKNNIKTLSSMCCGCGACSEVCPKGIISIPLNKEGFYQAKLNENECISCGKCVSVCPYQNIKNDKDIREAELYSYISNDKDVLLSSSSGGFAEALVSIAADKAAEVAGCVFDSHEHRAKHIIIPATDNETAYRLRGSKYIQSEFSPILKSIGKMPPGSVVIGTPCQIAGVKALLKGHKDVILVDLICHGVPSYNLYRKYLNYIENRKKLEIKDGLETVFRYKKLGWRERYIYNDNSKDSFYESQNRDPYFLAFEHGFCYSRSCYECPWRDRSAADLRIGDYWHKRYSDNNTGISMVAAITDVGKETIISIEQSGLGAIKKESILDYFECQQSENNPRPVFWEEFVSELNGSADIDSILDTYVVPFEKRKNMHRILQNLKRVINRNG